MRSSFLFLLIGFNALAQDWCRNLPANATFAQQKAAFYNYYKNVPASWLQDDDYARFKRLERQMEQYENIPAGVDPTAELWNVCRNWNGTSTTAKTTNVSAANWSPLGPFSIVGTVMPGQGRMISIYLDPTNPATVWAGSGNGGLWKSTNSGASWNFSSNGAPLLGVADIAIDPTNTNNMYIATGDKEAGGYSIGVLKSTNGGASWSPTSLSYSIPQYKHLTRLLVDPASPATVFASGTDGIFRSQNSGATWTLVKSGTVYDMEFNTAGTNTVYAASDSIYRSTDGGTTWKGLTGAPTFTAGFGTRVVMSVTPANPNVIYIMDNNYMAYKTTDGGASWTNIYSTVMGYGAYDMAITCSPVNASEVYIAGGCHVRSTDGGATWTSLPCNANQIHIDQQDLIFDPSGTKVYIVNDGGIASSTNSGTTWTYLHNGLNITEYYRFGCAANSKFEIFAGSQDNGIHKAHQGTWTSLYTGDESECLVDPLDSNSMYWSQGPVLCKSVNAGATFTVVLNDTGQFLCPYVMHPTNSQIIYFGGTSVKKTMNAGATWSTISPGFGYLNAMAVAPSNPNYIYTSTSYTGIWMTSNGGATWSFVNNNLPNFGPSPNIAAITVSNTNPNHVWVALGGYNAGSKVYESVNGGTSWTNVSTGLPNINMLCLAYNNNSPNDEIYIGTVAGVYYKDNSMSSWQPYNTNMPPLMIYDLEPHYLTGTLRACTYGRGIWETPLVTAIPTGIAGAEKKQIAPVIFPNPAKHEITIQLDEAAENIRSVQLTDALGREAMSVQVSGFENSVQLKDLKLLPGLYHVKVISSAGAYSGKVIIE